MTLAGDQPAQGHLWTRFAPWAAVFAFTTAATRAAEGHPKGAP